MKTIITLIAATLLLAAYCFASTGTGWYGEQGCKRDGIFWNCSSVSKR